MIERIKRNEERLDKVLDCIKKLEDAIEEYKENKRNMDLINNYYGSKNWFKDKEAYENNEIPKIKAGVLSEDIVWNMNEDLGIIKEEMRRIVNS